MMFEVIAVFRRLLPSLLLLATLGLHSLGFAAFHLGDSDPSIAQVQQILIARGYLSGVADGVYGSATFDAVRAFQAAQGLMADGVCGEATLALLFGTLDTTLDVTGGAPYAIRLGMSGPDVEELQNVLIALGYMVGEADGVAGLATVEAIRSFQGSHGLRVDGVCGEATFDAINAEAEGHMSGGAGAVGGYAGVGDVVRVGCYGPGVEWVQGRLVGLGYLGGGEVDGVCGGRTGGATGGVRTRLVDLDVLSLDDCGFA